MPVTNPGRGKLKPHLRKLRSGIWAVFYRDKYGHEVVVTQVSFMTATSGRARSARAWCIWMNAKTLSVRSPQTVEVL